MPSNDSLLLTECGFNHLVYAMGIATLGMQRRRLNDSVCCFSPGAILMGTFPGIGKPPRRPCANEPTKLSNDRRRELMLCCDQKSSA